MDVLSYTSVSSHILTVLIIVNKNRLHPVTKMSDTEVYLYDNDKSDIEISSDDCWESTDSKNISPDMPTFTENQDKWLRFYIFFLTHLD